MHRAILPLALLLSLTACHERQGPEPETSKLTEHIFTSSETDEEVTTQEKNIPITEESTQNNDTVLVDVPILEEELPIIPLPVEERTSAPKAKFTEKNQKRSGGVISDGLTMKTMRVSEAPERTRIVFDSYSAKNTKADVSGHYTLNYNAKTHRITLIVNGYKKFTALGQSKMRTFSTNSIIKKIYLVPYKDDSGYQCNIDLHKGANVNAFDLKAPGRIVIDITPN